MSNLRLTALLHGLMSILLFTAYLLAAYQGLNIAVHFPDSPTAWALFYFATFCALTAPCLMASALLILQRDYRPFSILVSGLLIPLAPIGTLIAAFSLWVLLSAQRAYGSVTNA